MSAPGENAHSGESARDPVVSPSVNASGIASGNLYAGIESAARDERFERLVAQAGVLIERIVSTGQASPEGFWYDDPRDEWVVLLTGAAELEFEGQGGARQRMHPGDYVHIPAHCRHRVAWTDTTAPTVWLAVYFGTDVDARE
ncbi:cupin domain-containing protein [Paraburkholderia tagetis]|uniref:Cupin domain-containing protein n=1 Tax=Paraburkholderia tagetis TaxID=2913261 RepID=A0A9X1UL57_9BURK|nr:cupin domain-containing protein [Paraburkholderia tagetis]MCG5077380.1 cupin domain-containing protein [Paraburkholderia tagetis]